MTSISPLENILKKGLYGDHEGKDEDKLTKVKEIKNLLIVQIVKYKNSSSQIEETSIDGLSLPQETLKVNSNNDSRILWCGPKNWLLVSTKKGLLKNISEKFIESDFAVTDLSHSRAIFEIEGKNVKEVLKKGCPFNFNILEKNNSINSTYNGIAFTLDILDNNPNKIRVFALRSFGESFYHSITDAALEYGYVGI